MNINNENMQERGIKSLGNIADDYMKSMNELCGSLGLNGKMVLPQEKIT